MKSKTEEAAANNRGAMDAKIFRLFLLSFIACAMLSSCAITPIRTRSVTTVDISHGGVVQKPVVTDLSVNPTKVRGEASGNRQNLATIRNDAVINALVNAGNADVLIEPNFTITTRGQSATVVVTGFAGTYRNFRSMEDGDIEWLESIHNIHRTRLYDPTQRRTTGGEQQSAPRILNF